MSEVEKFKLWAEPEGYSMAVDEDGRWLSQETADAWRIWQAAREEKAA